MAGEAVIGIVGRVVATVVQHRLCQVDAKVEAEVVQFVLLGRLEGSGSGGLHVALGHAAVAVVPDVEAFSTEVAQVEGGIVNHKDGGAGVDHRVDHHYGAAVNVEIEVDRVADPAVDGQSGTAADIDIFDRLVGDDVHPGAAGHGLVG